MNNIIRRPELLTLLGCSDITRNTFFRLTKNGQLNGLPKPIFKDAQGYAYDKSAIMAWLALDRPEEELELDENLITRREVLGLLGISDNVDVGYFNNLLNRGKFPDFPQPVAKLGRTFVYGRQKVLAYLGLSEDPQKEEETIKFIDALSGKFAPKELKTKWEMRRAAANKNKPKTVIVKCIGEGW